jgi:GT2 family glycosyltransferase
MYYLNIVILTYNSKKHIDKCLKSIIAQKKIKSNIIIIDNNSTDDTLKLLSKFDITLIKNNVNKGFVANNQAKSYFKYKLTLFLNIDTYLVIHITYYRHLIRNQTTQQMLMLIIMQQ